MKHPSLSLLTICASAYTACAQPPTYAFEEVPTLGGAESYTLAISNSGWAVGAAMNAQGVFKAIRYRNGQIESLGALAGFQHSSANGVNDAGHAVGLSSASANLLNPQPCLFRDGVVTNLNTGPTQIQSGHARAINALDVIAGTGPFPPPSGYGACTWTPVPQTTGFVAQPLLFAPIVPCYSHAFDINDVGDTVGWFAPQGRCGGELPYVVRNGTATVLQTLGGANAEAYSLNNMGDAVGYSELSNGQRRAALWRAGQVINLGAIGSASFAQSINDAGDIVGYYIVNNRTRACIWIDKVQFDLSNAAPPLGYSELHAFGINDSGQIIGHCRDALGRLRGFVMTPTEAPRCFADFNSDGGIDGGDIEAFFISWETGLGTADVNLDGGVDGGDVEHFFRRWVTGEC